MEAEEAAWQEILAKERMAETLYEEYRQVKLACALLRATYAKEYGVAPHLRNPS